MHELGIINVSFAELIGDYRLHFDSSTITEITISPTSKLSKGFSVSISLRFSRALIADITRKTRLPSLSQFLQATEIHCSVGISVFIIFSFRSQFFDIFFQSLSVKLNLSHQLYVRRLLLSKSHVLDVFEYINLCSSLICVVVGFVPGRMLTVPVHSH